jgi:hypothetical protein
MKKILIFCLIALGQVWAKVAYVDSAATGVKDGTSWANAWTSLNSITGMGAGDTVYISGGTTSKVYPMGSWTPPSGNANAQFTLSISGDAGHNGTVVFRNSAGASNLFNFSNYVTINGRLAGQNKFRVEGYGITAYMDGPEAFGPGGATGIKLLGLNIDSGIIRMYDSRKVEIGWVVFELYKRTGWAAQCIVGIGRGDVTGYGNNSIHDCTFNLYYIHGVDSTGSNGNDGIDHVGSIDIYNNKFIGVLTTGSAGGDHQDHIMTDGGFVRIFNNYFENAANYHIFGGFYGTSASNWQIFNNVCNYSDPVLNNQPTCSIAWGTNNPAHGTYNNVYIFNNTIRGGDRGISVGNPGDVLAANC